MLCFQSRFSSRAAPSSKRSIRRKGQRGFVLAATLWILAIITIAAAYFAERVGNLTEQARQKQQNSELLIDFANTRANLLYRFGTTRFSRNGLGAQPSIALDDRPYHGLADDIVRLQDQRGLLNVNRFDREVMWRFLGEIGVASEKRDRMIDTLLDYVDADDLRRINGAESAEYSALGLPVPPNEFLVSPLQLKNIIGWGDQVELWENQRLMRFVSTSRVNGFNPNTAPLEVLASLAGSNRIIAAELIKMRAEQPFYTSRQLEALTGTKLDEDSFLYFPGNSVRITHQSSKLPWALQYSLTLTPQNEDAPWRIDYSVKTVAPYPIENVDKIPQLPAESISPSD